MAIITNRFCAIVSRGLEATYPRRIENERQALTLGGKDRIDSSCLSPTMEQIDQTMLSTRQPHPGAPLARPTLYRPRSVVGFICVVLIAFFSPRATYLSFAAFVTPVTLCVYVGLSIFLLSIINKHANKAISEPEFFFLIYFCVIIFSYTWSLSLQNWYNYAFWWGMAAATFIITSQFCNTLPRLKWVLYGSILGAVIAVFSMETIVDEWGRTTDRYGIDTLNSNFSAYILSGSVFMIAALSRVIPFGLGTRLSFAAYTIVVVYAEILLGTRGAVISTCAVVVWSLVGTRFSRYVTIVIFIATMFAAVSLSTGLFDYFLLSIDSITSRSTGDLTGRLQIWPDAIEFISQHPLLGIGPGSFVDVGYNHVGAHNVVLTILLDTGLVGLCIMIMFFVSVFSSILKHMDRQVGPFIAMLFAVYLVPIATSGHWEGAPFSWLLVAFTYSLAKAAKMAPAPEPRARQPRPAGGPAPPFRQGAIRDRRLNPR